jgi:hypothetical protein
VKIYIISQISDGKIVGYETRFRNAMELMGCMEERRAIDRVTLQFRDMRADAVGAVLMAHLQGFAAEVARVYESPVDNGQEQPHAVSVDKPTDGE